MRYILICFLFISFMYSSFLEPMSFKSAVAEAKGDDKVIMLMYGQDDCDACQIVMDKTFENYELVSFIQENFHYSYINITKNRTLRGLYARGTPTFYFLNKDKKVLKKFIGALNVKNMKSLLDDVLLKASEGEIN